MTSILITIGRSLVWLWPFISEMFFEGKPFKQIVRENRVVVVLLAIIVVLLFWSYMSMITLHKLINKDPPPKQNPAKVEEPHQPHQTESEFEKELANTRDRLDRIFP